MLPGPQPVVASPPPVDRDALQGDSERGDSEREDDERGDDDAGDGPARRPWWRPGG